MTAAAVISQKTKQRIHRVELRGIDHEATVLTRARQVGVCQLFQMKGKRRGRNVGYLGNPARGQTRRPGLYQRAEYRQPGGLGQRG